MNGRNLLASLPYICRGRARRTLVTQPIFGPSPAELTQLEGNEL
ncbi:MAG: hypothetical protein R3E79_38075 [Caldilineaceae bacterium]